MNILQPSPLAEVLKKIPLVYLATPYTLYPGGIELAHQAAAELTAKLLRGGIKLFSPIVNCHAISIHGGINPIDHDFWMNVDNTFMNLSGALLIGKLDGWDSSVGVKEETDRFRQTKKPIFLIDPYTMELERDHGLRREKESPNLHRGPRLFSFSSTGNS